MKRLTNNEFIVKAQRQHGDVFLYDCVNYVAMHTKVVIGCKLHGYYEQTPSNHLTKSGCHKCAVESRSIAQKSTTEDFIRKAILSHNNTFDYSKVQYENSSTKVIILCKQHGHFFQTPNEHLNGKGCDKCGGTATMDTPVFIEKANLVHGNLYDYSNTKYIRNKMNVSIICKLHGEFTQKPNNHLYGKGCPRCSFSVGEKKMVTILKKHKVEFEHQYRLAECKKKKPLPFDFAIFSNSNLLGLIEYHGIQHYVPQTFGSKNRTMNQMFKSIQSSDSKKKKFCKMNNIPLLIIPYTEQDCMEEKVIQFLTSRGQ